MKSRTRLKFRQMLSKLPDVFENSQWARLFLGAPKFH